MTENEVEQITKEPEQKVERIKDPKKVAAGKRLAEYHKKAKKALIKHGNVDESNEVAEEDNTKSSWMPDISLTTALSLVGIGLTAFDLYSRYIKTQPNDTKRAHKPIRDVEYEDKSEPVVISTRSSNPSVPRRFGME